MPSRKGFEHHHDNASKHVTETMRHKLNQLLLLENLSHASASQGSSRVVCNLERSAWEHSVQLAACKVEEINVSQTSPADVCRERFVDARRCGFCRRSAWFQLA